MKPSTCRKLEIAGAPVLTPRLLPLGEKLESRKERFERMQRQQGRHYDEYRPPQINARNDWCAILRRCSALEDR